MICVFCWRVGYGKSGCVFSLVKLILINVYIKYLWHIKIILLPPALGAIFIVNFEWKRRIYGVTVFGKTIFGVTVFGIMQY